MALFKCKMCGGALEIQNNETVAMCEYCGTKQTLPKLDDDKRINMYDRANHFRRNNEFDKAMGIYEQILNEDNTDAEVYWSLVLCRYGIEYVEDPSSHKRMPTVNRAQFTSIFDDDNYKSALQYADSYQCALYEEEAKSINEIQKGILAISQKEEPFDVFICYKESDANGRRTPDSVLATDLYHQLTQEGFKVFFSRITLEDKLGSAYEPYIFAALNSSKVMVVLGTKPEYFNAVWVKNEWSRYLSLIKNGAKKILIPAYRDMDPYDLPEEFSHLQAQDMSKLGFMQDLIRGIKKILDADAPKQTVVKETVVSSENTNIAPLLKRVFIFLEDADWDSADEYCEKVLDTDPENAKAYLGKLMVDLKVRKQSSLAELKEPFDYNNNFLKAIRYGDETFKSTLNGYIDSINTRNENARLEDAYERAKVVMRSAQTEESFKEAAKLFLHIFDFKDSAHLKDICLARAEDARKDGIYKTGVSLLSWNDISKCESALKHFEAISGFGDADQKAQECREKIERLKFEVEQRKLEKERQDQIKREKAEKQKRIIKKMLIIITIAIVVSIAFVIILNSVIIPSVKYNNAIELLESGNANEAYWIFQELGDYKDSIEIAGDINLTKIKNAKVGDYVFFGSYEQDNDTTNGKEDIEWLVLEVKDEKILVISKYALDCKQYNTSYKNVTWETCTLRKWLNKDFFNTAFSDYEKTLIPTVTASADKNPEYSTDPGNATQDQIFLLSITEVNKYFSSDNARQCKPTDYAVAKGTYTNLTFKSSWWLLRTPGESQYYISVVVSRGTISSGGNGVDINYSAVRPAMWIDIND